MPPKCSYTTGLETLARAATSSTLVASKPRSANSCRPMAISCSRRCAADMRTREVAGVLAARPDAAAAARAVRARRPRGSVGVSLCSVTRPSCQRRPVTGGVSAMRFAIFAASRSGRGHLTSYAAPAFSNNQIVRAEMSI